MRLRTTLALMAVLAVLCAGYWAMQWHGERVEHRADEARRVFDFEADAIRFLKINRIDEAPTAATRDEKGVWHIVEPNPTIAALQELWDRVALNLAKLHNERTIADAAADAAEYGLVQPLLEVSAETSSGQHVELAVGTLEPTHVHRYARLDNGPLFLITTGAFFELNRSLELLRDAFLVNDRDAAILRFELARIWTGRGNQDRENPPAAVGQESVQITLERDSAEAPWVLVAPIEAPANQEMVNRLVDEFRYARGYNFVDAPEDLGDYGLDPANVRVTVADEHDSGLQTVLLGDIDASGKGGFFAKRADREAVFLMDAHILTLFPPTPDAFRERRLLTRQVGDIRALRYRAREDEFLLEKDAQGTWRMVRPAQEDTDHFAVSEYLAALKQVAALDFPTGRLEDYGLDNPEVMITLTMADADTPRVIRLNPSAEDDDHYYATQDTGPIVRLYRSDAITLLTHSRNFQSRELLRFTKSDAVELDFEFEGQRYVFEKVHGKWLVKAPENKTLANQSDADILMDAINPLVAVDIEKGPSVDLAAYGLDSPIFSIYVTTGDPEAAAQQTRLGPLRIGKVTPDNSQRRYAMIPGREDVYRVTQDVVEAVREALRGVGDKEK